MQPISKYKESDKFNYFIKECQEFSKYLNSDIENVEISKSFPRFVLNLYFKLNEQEIEDALFGLGSNDDGLDAFFYSENEKKTYFIQFKSRKNFDQKENKDAKKEWFSMLSTFPERIIEKTFITKNKRIKEIKYLLENDLKDYEQKLYIFHLGEASQDIENNFSKIDYNSQKSILEEFIKYYEKNLPDNLAPNEIFLEISPKQTKDFNNQNNFIYFTPKGNNGKSRKTVVFPINGIQVIDLLAEGTTILDRNVRGYLGESNSVNKGIIKTALENPEFFYFFNNGISITCDEIKVIGLDKGNPTIKLTKPQIINGAQTVNSLHVAFKHKLNTFKKNNKSNYEEEARNFIKDIHILCKIMESNKHIKTNFAKDVTQYSNTQNKIKPTDFYSNRPEQDTIKKEIAKYGITYNIKRGKNFEEKEKYCINMEDLGENHYAQKEEPFTAKSTAIFIDGCEEKDDSIYTKIFGNKGGYNFERTLELTKTFFIYHFTWTKFTQLKKIYNEVDFLIGKPKEEVDKFVEKNKEFIKITKSKTYVYERAMQKTEPTIDNISKYIMLMDFKILSYIIRQIIDKHSFINKEQDAKKISAIMELFIKKNNYYVIENLIYSILSNALSIYAKSIKEMFKENSMQKRHPKTKEAKRIIKEQIEDFISDYEKYIEFDFN